MARMTIKIDFDAEKVRKLIQEWMQNNPDVVEVVRCKDCVYRTGDGRCRRLGEPMLKPKDDFFCKCGKRKEQRND